MIALNAEGLIRYAQIYYICERGCNAHIVRFPHNEEVTKIDPRGVDFRNRLKISQTNNVCVAPSNHFLSLRKKYHDSNPIFLWLAVQ